MIISIEECATSAVVFFKHTVISDMDCPPLSRNFCAAAAALDSALARLQAELLPGNLREREMRLLREVLGTGTELDAARSHFVEING